MPIVAGDILVKLSGGASNAVPASSLGGVISSETMGAAIHSLFDYVTGAEAVAGDTEYRCVYVKNTHATLTLYGAVVWISANTPSASTEVTIGLGTSAISATEQTVANEGTAPSGVSFSLAASEGAALVIGDLAAGATKALWVKRVVTAGAAAYASDTMELTIKGDTPA